MNGFQAARKWFSTKISLAIVLGTICLLAYEPWRMENSSGDTLSARYWPVAILKHGTWKLNPFREEMKEVRYLALLNGTDLLPRLGWGMAVFSVPFYAAADLFQTSAQTQWSHERIASVSRWTSVLLATGSAVLLFLLLARFSTLPVAFVSSVLFALGTWNWSLAPQGLSSQTAAVFCHVVNLHLLWQLCTKVPRASRSSPRLAVLMAVLHVLVWSVRPQDVVLFIPALFALKYARVLRIYLITGVTAILPVLLIYKNVYHDYFGAYGALERMSDGVQSWSWGVFSGLSGLLFSPNRGAIVFFPLLLLAPFLVHKLTKPVTRAKKPLAFGADFFKLTAAGAAAYFFLLCFLSYWHSTWSYGPRYLYELQPALWPLFALALADAWNWLQGRKHRLPAWSLGFFLIFNVQAIFIHALGHTNYDLYVWNSRHASTEEGIWKYDDWIIQSVWQAGSNRNRWTDVSSRLQNYGF